MKGLGTLFCFELRKIWTRPLLWLVLAVCVFFLGNEALPLGSLSDSPSREYSTVGKDGAETTVYLTPREVFDIKREAEHQLDGQKMDDAFFAAMKEAMPEPSQMAGNFSLEDYVLLETPEYGQLWNRMRGEYTAESYYSAIGGLAQRLANQDLEGYLRLTDEEADYWKGLEDQVEKPYTYYDTAAIQEFNSVFYLASLLMPIVVGVCLCGVIPTDRRERLDGVVFSTKRGRECLGTAKLLAAAVSAALVCLILFGTVLGGAVLFRGICPQAQIQLYLLSSYPITVGEELLLTLLTFILYSLLVAGWVMLVSLAAGDAVAGVLAGLVPTAVDLFLDRQFDGTPLHLFQGNLFSTYHLVKAGGLLLTYLQAALLVFALGVAVLLLACGVGWQRKAVSRR